MQAVPVTLVQEVSTIMYKTMGVENSQIVQWTSIIALPWALQMILGPLVDLNSSKRNWVLFGQLAIFAGLIAAALVLQLPNFFGISLALLGTVALFSAMCNIATDGFYILSLSRERQAAYVGLNSTFYRLGRLFCSGLLVYWVGLLIQVPAVKVRTEGGAAIAVASVSKVGNTEEKEIRYLTSATLRVEDRALVHEEAGRKWQLEPPLKLPKGTLRVRIGPDGMVAVDTPGRAVQVGLLPLRAVGQGPGTVRADSTGAALPTALGWGVGMLLAAAIYVLGRVLLSQTLPRPERDVWRPVSRATILPTIFKTALLIGFALSLVIALGNVLKFVRHGLGLAGVTVVGPFEVGWWTMTPEQVFFEGIWLVGTVLACVLGTFLIRRDVARSDIGQAFTSFYRMPGFWAILGFLIFYRFGEVMVARISPLFFLDPSGKGGLGLSTSQVGLVNGTMGVIGIVVGGIVGGIFLSRVGLRKGFWALALAMHVPNFMYLWAASVKPNIPADASEWQVILSPISGIVFLDQFGYGFGFAAYMVYLMWVAQRGLTPTAHYAIGTGLGATLIASVGIFTAQVLDVFKAHESYVPIFITVLICAIPGMVMLLLIPLDKNEARDIQVTEIGD